MNNLITMTTASNLLNMDDIFHSCALRAYVEEARIAQGWPDSDKVRLRAYRYYEEALRG